MEKVTIIVPIYNVEQYLERCIESILHQTYKNIEIICVNDCSPDNSQKILERYEKEGRIKVLVNEKNLGLGKSRERAMKYAAGSYIMFIDSDDYIADNYVEKYMDSARQADYDIVVGGYVRDVEGNLKKHLVKQSDWSILSYTIACAKLYKTSFLKNNNIGFIDIRCGEDIYFSMELFLHKPNYYVMEEYAGYYYYYNNNSITGSMNADKKLEVFISTIFDEFLTKYPTNGMDKEVYWKICYNYLSNMINALIVHGHGCKRKEMMDKYNFYIRDLKNKFPDYQCNPFIHFRKMKGQSLKIRIAVSLMMFLNRIGLDKWVYLLVSLF